VVVAAGVSAEIVAEEVGGTATAAAAAVAAGEDRSRRGAVADERQDLRLQWCLWTAGVSVPSERKIIPIWCFVVACLTLACLPT
jgi:hypothetical protein